MNFKVSFGIDTDTEEIFDFKIIKENSDGPHIMECDPVTFNNTTLQLNSEILKALGIKTTNEKIAFVFEMNEPKLINPRIHPVPTDGSRISKKFTISVRGKNKDKLTALGSDFGIKKVERGRLILLPLSPPTKQDNSEEE